MNLQEIKDLEPCIDGWKNLIKHYPNWEGTALEFLDLEHISVEDKQWLFLREEYIPKRELHLYACFCAEQVLHLFEEEYPDDKRPREAIEAKRLWLDGKISDDALDSASAWDSASPAASASASARALENQLVELKRISYELL